VSCRSSGTKRASSAEAAAGRLLQQISQTIEPERLPRAGVRFVGDH
jgi:hypothetical protein